MYTHFAEGVRAYSNDPSSKHPHVAIQIFGLPAAPRWKDPSRVPRFAATPVNGTFMINMICFLRRNKNTGGMMPPAYENNSYYLAALLNRTTVTRAMFSAQHLKPSKPKNTMRSQINQAAPIAVWNWLVHSFRGHHPPLQFEDYLPNSFRRHPGRISRRLQCHTANYRSK